ncbi:DUF4405 domain-containing protein, partial [Rhizobium ruizarguesonis]
ISRSVFAFLPLNGGPTAREIHILAAYWAFFLAAVHLGLHWSMIMAVIVGLLRVGAPNAISTASLRAATGAIAAWGIHSLHPKSRSTHHTPASVLCFTPPAQ